MPLDKPVGITLLGDFTKTIQSANLQQFAGKPGVKVLSDAHFQDMKSHLIKLYAGIQPQHSFVDANGSIFDCIPIEQQPALRGKTIATPIDIPAPQSRAGEPVADRKPIAIQPPLQSGQKDSLGNAMTCPAGTIPMRRVTLEELTRFETLQNFFRKGEGTTGRPPVAPVDAPVAEAPKPAAAAHAVAATHRWAHAFQNVNNLGGHSFLNVWQPHIGANQIFSLSQHWYVGGSGANLQTAECGWQVYPQKYGRSNPVLFIYWTADDYNKTGCYNMDCSAFVQVNNGWAIGASIAPTSVAGGAQYEIQLAFYLYKGNWWLYLGGTSASNAIGYYPTSLYNHGALASHATEIDYGGEVVGTTSWPPMGSGGFANTGWQHAAYQRDIYYYPTAGGASFAGLTPSQSWPKCYTAQVTFYGSPWYETLWYGGPGGNNC
ncbi:MAG TPA: neprosin family prolyl endopeptidase [Bryobacteraceae bacterium]|nr:neprosin family prolyl endopeptidase [Bryobacteraceae bacterium]